MFFVLAAVGLASSSSWNVDERPVPKKLYSTFWVDETLVVALKVRSYYSSSSSEKKDEYEKLTDRLGECVGSFDPDHNIGESMGFHEMAQAKVQSAFANRV